MSRCHTKHFTAPLKILEKCRIACFKNKNNPNYKARGQRIVKLNKKKDKSGKVQLHGVMEPHSWHNYKWIPQEEVIQKNVMKVKIIPEF